MADYGILARLTQQASDNIFREQESRSRLFAQARQEIQQDRQLRLQESNAIANRMSQADQMAEQRRQNDIRNQQREDELEIQRKRLLDGDGGGEVSVAQRISAIRALSDLDRQEAAYKQAVLDREQTNERRKFLGKKPLPPLQQPEPFNEKRRLLDDFARGVVPTAQGGREPPPSTSRQSTPAGPLPEGGRLDPLLNPDTTARVPDTTGDTDATANIPDIALKGDSSAVPHLFPGGQQEAPLVATPVTPPPGGFRDSTPPPSIGPSEAARLKRRGITPEQAAAEQARQVALAAQRSQESMASVFKSADVLAADPTEKPVPIKTQKGTVLVFREDDPSAYERNKDYIDTLESKILPLAEMIEVEKDEQTRIEIQGRIDKIKHVAGKLRERAPKPEKEKATRTPSEGDVGLIMAIQKFNKANKIKSPSDYKDLDAPLDPEDLTGEGPSIGDAYKALRIRGSLTDDLKALDPLEPATASGDVVPNAEPPPTATGQPERKPLIESF